MVPYYSQVHNLFIHVHVIIELYITLHLVYKKAYTAVKYTQLITNTSTIEGFVQNTYHKIELNLTQYVMNEQ